MNWSAGPSSSNWPSGSFDFPRAQPYANRKNPTDAQALRTLGGGFLFCGPPELLKDTSLVVALAGRGIMAIQLRIYRSTPPRVGADHGG